MSNIDDGGPVLPVDLCDYFAGLAMQGLIASDAFHDHLCQDGLDKAALFAYAVADEMLEARSAT